MSSAWQTPPATSSPDAAHKMSDSTNRNPLQKRELAGRLQRLVLKELREILRDRRTMITLLVMPILIYPLLAVVFQRFLVTSINAHEEASYIIGVDSRSSRRALLQQLRAGETELKRRDE